MKIQNCSQIHRHNLASILCLAALPENQVGHPRQWMLAKVAYRFGYNFGFSFSMVKRSSGARDGKISRDVTEPTSRLQSPQEDQGKREEGWHTCYIVLHRRRPHTTKNKVRCLLLAWEYYQHRQANRGRACGGKKGVSIWVIAHLGQTKTMSNIETNVAFSFSIW